MWKLTTDLAYIRLCSWELGGTKNASSEIYSLDRLLLFCMLFLSLIYALSEEITKLFPIIGFLIDLDKFLHLISVALEYVSSDVSFRHFSSWLFRRGSKGSFPFALHITIDVIIFCKNSQYFLEMRLFLSLTVAFRTDNVLVNALQQFECFRKSLQTLIRIISLGINTWTNLRGQR